MITHLHPEYVALRKEIGKGKYNGCYYYSREIVKNIIPRVKTWRDWNTVGRDFEGMHDHMIVFLHDNSTPWNYEWLRKYKDLVLVCSSQYTMDSVKYSGRAIFLPMSIDTDYVKKFKHRHTKDYAFVGNIWVLENCNDSMSEVDILSGLSRPKLLDAMSRYKHVYCQDRCALEAECLGCKVERIDTRYSVDTVGRVVDNKEAAEILQKELDKLERSPNEKQEKPAFYQRG